MLFSKKKKTGNEQANGGFEDGMVPGQSVVFQTSLPDCRPQEADWLILMPVFGLVRSYRQEACSHA